MFDIMVGVLLNWPVISNGASGHVHGEGDAHVHTFVTTPRMSTYLVALIAGCTRTGVTPIPTNTARSRGAVLPRIQAEFMDHERLFTETKQDRVDHNNFGAPYAFGKNDEPFVPESNARAMENAGAVTFPEDYVFRSKVTSESYQRRAETVLHEMARMRFGELVTMSGGTTCGSTSRSRRSPRCCARRRPPIQRGVDDVRERREVVGVPAGPAAIDASGRRRHPDLHAVEADFDGITYAKGASVLKQLVAYVGLEEFRPVCGLLPRPRIERHVRRPARRAREGLRPRPFRLGPAVVKTTGLNTPRPDSMSTLTGGSPAPRSPRAGAARRR